MPLEALDLARELGRPGVMALEDGLALGVDHGGQGLDQSAAKGFRLLQNRGIQRGTRAQ